MSGTPGEHQRYRLDRLIAPGGTGQVWLGTDTLLERTVAIKVLKPEHAEDPVFRARFAAEARHAAALAHPHVAGVLDYGELPVPDGDAQPFLVLEHVEGRSLSELLVAGVPLDPEQAADLVAQAAEGIQAAHERGIVHRDVKPGNLLVSDEGQVKVADFGIARAADASGQSGPGRLVGTPHYLSPEQAQGRSATPASDVYALGIVLFEILAGHRPFQGEGPEATALAHVREPLPPLPDEVPERLRRITATAAAKDPDDRYRSAGDLAAALRAQTPESRPWMLPPARDGGAPPAPSTELRRGAVTGGLLALLVLGTAMACGLSGPDAGAPPPDGPATSRHAGTGHDTARGGTR